MFSLDSSMRYWLYNKPVNMRMGFNGLSGIVNNHMGMDSKHPIKYIVLIVLYRKFTMEEL